MGCDSIGTLMSKSSLVVWRYTVIWRSWINLSWYNYENNQQDALYRLIYYFKSALHVSGDDFPHHQEHLTVFTESGSVHPSCCRLVSQMIYMFRTMVSPIIRNTWLYLQNLVVFTQVAAGWCLKWSTCFGRCFRPSSGALDYLQYLVVFTQVAAGC
jgi:hypothetical protein